MGTASRNLFSVDSPKVGLACCAFNSVNLLLAIIFSGMDQNSNFNQSVDKLFLTEFASCGVKSVNWMALGLRVSKGAEKQIVFGKSDIFIVTIYPVPHLILGVEAN